MLVAYGPALGVGYYSDDFQWLGRMAPTLERPSFLFSVFYRDFNPVLHLSFLLDYVAGGGSPMLFHATSLVVHALNTALLFLLCRRMSLNDLVAGAAALTWGLNVRLSEAVIWPAARGHSLATLFVLSALLCLGSESRRQRWLSPALFLLALLSKETAVFPMVLAPLFMRDLRACRRLLATLYLMAATFVAFNVLFKPELHLSQESALQLALKVPFLLLRPLGIGDYYDFSYPMMALVLGAFAALAVLLRGTAVRIGLLWLAACLVPIAPLAQLSSRYLYMLSVGYALALCGIWELVSTRLPTAAGRKAIQALAAAAVGLVTVSNVLLIDREIEDYDLLSRPYETCLEALRAEAGQVPDGQALVVLDASPRDAVPSLNRLIAERGGMAKLIPYRPMGVGGLIELEDILNIAGGGNGRLATRVEPLAARDAHLVMYDGRRAWRARSIPSQPLPRERVLAARLGSADLYFAGP